MRGLRSLGREGFQQVQCLVEDLEVGTGQGAGAVGQLGARMRGALGAERGPDSTGRGAAEAGEQSVGLSVRVVLLTQDGDEPWDKAEVRSMLQNTASLWVFWLFVGFGRGELPFYKNLNASASASDTNVAFCDASKNPGSVSARGSTRAWSTPSLPGC